MDPTWNTQILCEMYVACLPVATLVISMYKYCGIWVVFGCDVNPCHSVMWTLVTQWCEPLSLNDVNSCHSVMWTIVTQWCEPLSLNDVNHCHSVVTVVTRLLFTSERSHYFRKSYLEERGLTSPNRTQIDLLKYVQKFLKVLTLAWVAGTNAIKDNNRAISQRVIKVITNHLT